MVYTTITLSVISTDDGRAEFVAPKTPLGFIKDATTSTGAQSGYGYASALSFVYFFTVILTLGILLLIFAYFSRRKEK
jgi:ABC-type sugar transport system permease subunit